MAHDSHSLRSRLGRWVVAAWLSTLIPSSEVFGQSGIVRLAVVQSVEHSGLLEYLLPDFEKQSGYHVLVTSSTTDVFARARRGEADLVISHFGFDELERFVQDGLGFWPRTLFANQSAILGPAADPAHIRGAGDCFEAFRRIAQARATFITNDLSILELLVETLWEGAGRPDRGGWYLDLGLSEHFAVQEAAERGAYTVWGVDPSLRFIAMHKLDLEVLCFADPILQRNMTSVVVNPEFIKGVNVEGALALERYLRAPATQARIRAFRYPGHDEIFWWPAAIHN